MSSPRAERTWQSYEEVARYLLDEIAAELELDRVEGEQRLVGRRSGTMWTVEGKGVKAGDGEGFLILECRRYTKSRLNQEAVGGMAYRIWDTGAAGGILVSPRGLQAGAERVGAAENIVTVQLDENSTTTEYLLRFLNRVFVGVADEIVSTDAIQVEKSEG